MKTKQGKVDILGIKVDMVNKITARNYCVNRIENGTKTFVVTPNAEIIDTSSKDSDLKELINQADLVVPDGIGVVLASKILKKPLEERVTGIDLMNSLIDYAANHKKSIYLLGAKRVVVRTAAEKLEEKYPDLEIKGFHHGYFLGDHNENPDHKEQLEVVKEINELKPDIVFVAMGFPWQELFIKKYMNEIDATLFMGVGGSFDVISGIVKRAPESFQKLGLEWLYRFMQNPTRVKRFAALPSFALKVISKDRNKEKKFKKNMAQNTDDLTNEKENTSETETKNT